MLNIEVWEKNNMYRNNLYAVLGVLTLFLAGLCILSGCPPQTNPIDITGEWVGTLVSSGHGELTLDAHFIQNGNQLSGVWASLSSKKAVAKTQYGGTLSGTITGSNIYVLLVPSDTDSCSYAATATVNGGTISGTFVTTDCSQTITGTVTLSDRVSVPDVVDMTKSAAQSAITRVFLTVGTVTQEYNSTVPSGKVISQSPSPDTIVLPGIAVNLVVSKGPEPVPVPNVVGMTQAEAEVAITNAGLIVGAVTQQYSPTVPLGKVISQSPSSGANLVPGKTVNLVVSKGPEPPVSVPNVVGMTQTTAQSAITSAGLTVGTVTQEYSETVPSGKVIRQDPLADASVPARTAVNLVVSKGPYRVPGVVGMTQAAAESAITGAGLTVGTVTQVYSATVSAGSVISQDPSSGTIVPPGTAVNLVLSKGPQPVLVPDVVGMAQATGVAQVTFTGHVDGVFSVAYSPDGTKVLTGSTDGTVRLWDASTGEELHTFTIASSPVAYSPDGTSVLTGSYCGTCGLNDTAQLWDAATGAVLHTFTESGGYLKAVAFSPDGTRVLTGSGCNSCAHNVAKLWNASTGEVIRTFKGHKKDVTSVAMSPDGSKVLTGSSDGTARLWDEATGEQLHTFTGALSPVAFSPDGTKILTGMSDSKVTLWDAVAGAKLQTFKDAEDSAAFSPDGTRLLMVSAYGNAKLWDASTGAVLQTFTEHTSWVSSVAYSPDGTSVLTGSGDMTAKLWDAESAAAIVLTDAGLTLGTVTAQYSATVPINQVISQDPAAGASVPPGRSVNLVVSMGPQP